MTLGKKFRNLWLPAKRAGMSRCMHRARRILATRYTAPKRLGPKLAQAHFPGMQIRREAAVADLLTSLASARQDGEFGDSWQLERGMLSLLNSQPFPFNERANGQEPANDDPLWLFVLHGWEWAWPHLTAGKKRLAVQEAVDLWWAQNPMGEGMAWEPYPTSRRLIVWCVAWYLLGLDQNTAQYLARTAHYLAQRLERDLDNNHLFVNLKALTFFDLLFPMCRQMQLQQRSRNEMATVLRRHLHPDGGHFESSTGYHLGTWLDTLDVALLGKVQRVAMPTYLEEALKSMERFACTLMRPDGRLPMLGDTVMDEPLPLQTISRLARLYEPRAPQPITGSVVQPHSGYHVLHKGRGDNQVYVCFDTGNLGPDHCPGHGHADMLAVEVWVGGQPLWLDGGTYQYKAGERRSYYRGTASHNTVCVDQLDQVDFVGPFRIGYLGHGKLVDHRLGEDEDAIVGSHDGYQRLAESVTHQRKVRLEAKGDLHIEDSFTGSGIHQLTASYHCAPGCTAAIEDGGVAITLANGQTRYLRFEGDGSIHLEKGTYSESWFREVEITVIRYKTEASLPTRFTAHLTPN